MAPAVPIRPTQAPGPYLSRSLYRLTVAQYARMIEEGTIAEGERISLIEGLLVVRPRRIRAEIVATNKGLRVLWRMIPPGWHVTKGVPIRVSDWSRPEPDLAVVRGIVDEDEGREPTAAETAMVVEIAGAHADDRAELARVYAAAGVPVCWIVDLAEARVDLFSEPRREGYRSRQVLTRGQDIPLVVDGIEAAWIAVSDLLP